MVHSLRAIALHRLANNEEAVKALQRADEALDRIIQGMMLDSANDQRPWIDFVEMVLLHREATLAVTGKDIGLDPRIKQTQQRMRETLSF